MHGPPAVIIRLPLTWLVMLLTSAWLAIVQADEPDGGRECVQIADDGARLACYDRAFARRADVAQAPAAASAPQPEPAAAATGALPAAAATGALPAAAAVTDGVDQSATPAEAAATFGAEDLPRANVEPEAQLDSLEARIVEVQADRRGKHVYRLDNGQTWQQVEVTDLVPARVGDTVKISRGAFDSYRMRRTGGGRTVTVRRTN